MREVALALPLLLALGACSDAGGSGDSDDGSAAASGAAGAPGSGSGAAGTNGSAAGSGAKAGSSGGGVPSGGMASGGGTSAGAGGSSAGEVTPLELEPLAVGNLWTYALTVSEPTADCKSGSGTREVVATLEWEGRTALELHRFCDTEPTYLNVTDGEVYQYLDGWYRNVAAPVQDGATWSFAPGFTLKWNSAGSVTVPAGTFQSCWRRSILEFEGSITFCPGVGQVKIELPSVTAELSAYDLK